MMPLVIWHILASARESDFDAGTSEAAKVTLRAAVIALDFGSLLCLTRTSVTCQPQRVRLELTRRLLPLAVFFKLYCKS